MSDVCAFPDCGRPAHPRVKSATLCRQHHEMQLRGEELRPIRELGPKRVGCSFPGCDRPHCGKGLCKPHLMQSLRGRPLSPPGEPRGRSAETKAPKAKAPASRLPKGWDRVTPKAAPKRKPMSGAKVMCIEGPVPEIAPELAEMARRTLHRHGLDDLADMLGIADLGRRAA